MKRIDYFHHLHHDEQGTFADLGETFNEYLVRMHEIYMAALKAIGCQYEANFHRWLLTEVDVTLSITIVSSQLRRLRPTVH